MSVQCKYTIEIQAAGGPYLTEEQRFCVNGMAAAVFLEYFGDIMERSQFLEPFCYESEFAANSECVIGIDVDSDIIDDVWEAICNETAGHDLPTDDLEDLYKLKTALWNGFGYRMYFAFE